MNTRVWNLFHQYTQSNCIRVSGKCNLRLASLFILYIFIAKRQHCRHQKQQVRLYETSQHHHRGMNGFELQIAQRHFGNDNYSASENAVVI